VFRLTPMRVTRPLATPACVQSMLHGANFSVTARQDGVLIGLARCIADHAWIAYCVDLAMAETHQGQGIGQQLIATAKTILEPRIGLCLIA
ncbi:MAG: GNAT family N-acetyltransferase, partial [Candidatus Devosia euplotis]|nr:GNAT family N-acetyltransferase [Candidatus Devosia euplotis]